ncbi:hypothetical protein Riv7116_6146 [Rivularia sp. PCC 7116]|uniref:hypothetical protein n=1 Tax=Rivularia sp. PCC 7116 TaxID=373994 RepID=UPI00029F44AF|nr:hypothetical protein [Rivularia sp. PCC 7116]AFY58502.1 hypothetical protein Riv7116_6146 [Rivularia sp. PCC 7116]
MLEIGWFSAKLFFKGKLMRDAMYFVKQTSIGISITFGIMFCLAQTTIPFWVPVFLSSFVGGVFMPFLLKDLKMK